MKKTSFFKTISKFGTEPIFLIITTIATVLFGIFANLVETTHPLYQICDRGFYISLSLVLVQLLLQMTEIINNTNDLKNRLDTYDNVIFSDEKARINELFELQLKDSSARKVKIICYGTNTYGKYIEYIISKCSHIKTLEVVVCSPNITVISTNELDTKKICNAINEITETVQNYNKDKRKGQKKTIIVYLSNILPTIRASVIYNDEKKPIWCTTQAYRLYTGEGPLLRGDGLTPAIVASNAGNPIIENLSNSFEDEFNRLKKSCVEEIKLI